MLRTAMAMAFFFYATNGEATTSIDSKAKDKIKDIFEAFGYSSSCVAASLASCGNSPDSLSMMDCSSEMIRNSDRPRNCADLYAKNDKASGVRIVYPFACYPSRPVSVFCDQATDGGGWTVIQNRGDLPIREDFYRTWTEYVLGFGNLKGEFWLGLDHIHALTSSTPMEMRVDLEDYEGEKRWAKYRLFQVGDAKSNYTLIIGAYSGTAGESLFYQNGMQFSTHDEDHDINYKINCAKTYRGGYWYNGCLHSNLNGFQYVKEHSEHAQGINWLTFRGLNYSLKKASMKVRPKV